jgi:hypothetical protein
MTCVGHADSVGTCCFPEVTELLLLRWDIQVKVQNQTTVLALPERLSEVLSKNLAVLPVRNLPQQRPLACSLMRWRRISMWQWYEFEFERT